MANTTGTPVYLSGGPTGTLQVLARGGQSDAELAYIGTATITADNTASTYTVNYIDGTAALPFTPSAILVQRIGGSATATVAAVSAIDAGNANKTFTVQASATIPAGTFIIVFFILK